MRPAEERQVVTLDQLGVSEDPGTNWHPRPDKADARDASGDLLDLDDDQVHVHAAKPEGADQPDAGVPPLAAEDSTESPEGVI